MNIEEEIRTALDTASQAIPPPPPGDPEAVMSAEITAEPKAAPTTPAIMPLTAPDMVTVGGTEDFAEFYKRNRDPLYRSLVVAIKNRDVATEAVDRGFSVAYRKWKKVRNQHPDAAVFAASMAWADKKILRGGEVKGFRLTRTEPPRDEALVIDAFNDLNESYRAALVVDQLLGWEAERAAVALATTPEGVRSRIESASQAIGAALGLPAEQAKNRLRGALSTEAAGYTVPLSRLEAAKGHAWSRRLTVAAGSAAAVLVIGGGTLIGLNAFSGTDAPAATSQARSITDLGSGTTTATEPGETATTAPGQTGVIGSIAAIELDWSRVRLGIQGDVSAIASGPNGFLVIGQSWDGPGPQMFAFTSVDGIDWLETAAPDIGNQGGWINQVVTGEFGLAALGSSYNEFDGMDQPFVAISTDAELWTTYQLPVERETEVAGMQIRFYTNAQSIAKTSDGFIVLGDRWADMGDPQRFLGDFLPEDVNLNWGWGTSVSETGETTIEVYDRNGNLTFTSTLTELGVDPELATLMNQSQPVLWRSRDNGESWDQLSPGALFGPNSYVGRMTASGDTIVALVHGNFGFGSLYHTTNGTDWSKTEIERGAQINNLVSTANEFIAIGSKDSVATVWRSTNGIDWTATSLGNLNIAYLEQISVGPAGIAALGQTTNVANELPPATVFVDDWVVTVSQSGLYTVTGPDRSFELYGDEVTFLNNGGLSIPDPETGDVLISITGEEMNRAWEEVYRNFQGGFEGEQPTYQLLISKDGTTWSSVDMAEVFGPSFYPNQIALSESAVVISGWQEDNFGGQAPSASVWVGTVPSK